MANDPEAAGKRLGDLLRYRRVELNPAWRNRKVFAAAHNLLYRVVNDLENGNRFNFEPATITAAEVAYKLAPGSLRRSFGSGELEPAVAPPPRPGRFQVVPGGSGAFQDAAGIDARADDLITTMLAPDARRLRDVIHAVLAVSPHATGADIFADRVLADLWDLDMSEAGRLRLMATYVLRLRLSAEPAHRAG